MVLLIANILKISAEVKFPYFIYQRMWSPVAITCLLDYISDLTEMQILISKVTAASSGSASLPTKSGPHAACVGYCFIPHALSNCAFISPAEAEETNTSCRSNSRYLYNHPLSEKNQVHWHQDVTPPPNPTNVYTHTQTHTQCRRGNKVL